MLENAFRITIVLLRHRFTLISAVSSTGVNGLGMAPRGTEIRQKKRKIKTKTQNVSFVYCTDFPMSLFFLI